MNLFLGILIYVIPVIANLFIYILDVVSHISGPHASEIVLQSASDGRYMVVLIISIILSFVFAIKRLENKKRIIFIIPTIIYLFMLFLVFNSILGCA